MDTPWLKTLREYAEALIIALVLALFIRTFIVEAFKIPSESMLDTLLVGDQLLVTKFSYGVKIPFTDTVVIPVGDPERGDVIVFEYPKDPSKDYIKRIVGVPGDVIAVRDKQLWRNGELVEEPYAIHGDPNRVMGRDDFGPVTVPEDNYFVMGDNRDFSRDSRFWGFVERDLIQGKALIIYWSWDGKADSLTDKVRFSRIGDIIH